MVSEEIKILVGPSKESPIASKGYWGDQGHDTSLTGSFLEYLLSTTGLLLSFYTLSKGLQQYSKWIQSYQLQMEVLDIHSAALVSLDWKELCPRTINLSNLSFGI